jgi:hypothetical protein
MNSPALPATPSADERQGGPDRSSDSSCDRPDLNLGKIASTARRTAPAGTVLNLLDTAVPGTTYVVGAPQWDAHGRRSPFLPGLCRAGALEPARTARRFHLSARRRGIITAGVMRKSQFPCLAVDRLCASHGLSSGHMGAGAKKRRALRFQIVESAELVPAGVASIRDNSHVCTEWQAPHLIGRGHMPGHSVDQLLRDWLKSGGMAVSFCPLTRT